MRGNWRVEYGDQSLYTITKAPRRGWLRLGLLHSARTDKYIKNCVDIDDWGVVHLKDSHGRSVTYTVTGWSARRRLLKIRKTADVVDPPGVAQ